MELTHGISPESAAIGGRHVIFSHVFTLLNYFSNPCSQRRSMTTLKSAKLQNLYEKAQRGKYELELLVL